jgi:hypothetical protein
MVEKDIYKRCDEHHPKSMELYRAISLIDYKYCGDSLCWKSGGDGDNGEMLMTALDIYFECLEQGEEI